MLVFERAEGGRLNKKRFARRVGNELSLELNLLRTAAVVKNRESYPSTTILADRPYFAQRYPLVNYFQKTYLNAIKMYVVPHS